MPQKQSFFQPNFIVEPLQNAEIFYILLSIIGKGKVNKYTYTMLSKTTNITTTFKKVII